MIESGTRNCGSRVRVGIESEGEWSGIYGN